MLRNLDLDCLLAPEASLKCGSISEYSWQAQAYLLIYTILKQTPEFNNYRFVMDTRMLL